MPQSINENSRARGATLVCLVLSALALGIRFVGLSQPYHQDEYKWAFIVDPAHNAGEAAIPHPPLAEWLYHLTGAHFGYDHLRLLPFFASFIFGILLFYIVRRVYGLRAASLALFFWAIDLYAVLASLQIDIDGVLLPIFTLCMLGGYELWKTEKFSARVIALFAIGAISYCSGRGFCVRSWSDFARSRYSRSSVSLRSKTYRFSRTPKNSCTSAAAITSSSCSLPQKL